MSSRPLAGYKGKGKCKVSAPSHLPSFPRPFPLDSLDDPLDILTLAIDEMDWLLGKGGEGGRKREVAGTLPGRGMVMLTGVRCLPSEFFRQNSEDSDYENLPEEDEESERVQRGRDEGMHRTSSSPIMDVSMTLSEDSNHTLVDHNEYYENTSQTDSTSMSTMCTSTLKRRRSFQPKRNYRICDPDESQYWLQVHSNEYGNDSLRNSKGAKLLRRWSTRDKHKEGSYSPSPRPLPFPSPSTPQQEMVIVQSPPPSSGGGGVQSPSCNGDSRLSFASSSTGYSSARSSLRSTEGTEEDGNGGGSVEVLFSASSSLSESRLRQLMSSGGLSRMERIAAELIETERSYVNDLWQIIQGYLNYLVDVRDSLNLTVDDVSGTFGCIERIFQINRKLYSRLDEAELNCVQMCKCFIEFSGCFDDYVTYCTNYQRMLSTLSSISSRPRVSDALHRRQNLLGHSLPLSSYLLKPVQRILKYHLFIENMIKEVSSCKSCTIEDERIMKKALEVMTTQAARINEEKKRSEHHDRVQVLHAQIARWKTDESADLSAYGELLLEASFRIHGSKTTRLLFLFEEMLLIVKQRGNQYVCKDYIMCSNLMLNESVTDDSLAFQVLSFDNPRAQYIFLANNTEQKRVWVQELKRMVLDHYEVEIPEETKKLMLSMDHTQPKIPFGRPEFAEVSMKAQRKVPKYLEKRRKSVERKEREESPSRRRSLSASRMVLSEPSFEAPYDRPLKLFESEVKGRMSRVEGGGGCTCTQQAGTSHTHNQTTDPEPVSRTQSSSGLEGIPIRQTKRLYEGRRHRHALPPMGGGGEEGCREGGGGCTCMKKAPPPPPRHVSSDRKNLGNSEIEETFADLYRSLTMLGMDSVGCGGRVPTIAMRNKKSTCTVSTPGDTVAAARRLDSLVKRYSSDPEPVRLRSKSLTRLDDIDSTPDDRRGVDLPQLKKHRSAVHEQALRVKMNKLACIDIPSYPPSVVLSQDVSRVHPEVSRPLTAIDHRLLSPDADHLEKWKQKRELIVGPAPPVPDRWSVVTIDRHGRISSGSARQRTPLTVDQVKQLDNVLLLDDSSLGVVKEMVRQLERSGDGIDQQRGVHKSTLLM